MYRYIGVSLKRQDILLTYSPTKYNEAVCLYFAGLSTYVSDDEYD